MHIKYLFLLIVLFFLQGNAENCSARNMWEEGSEPGAVDSLKKSITLLTEDGVAISAGFAVPADTAGKYPALILIHQGGSDRSEWDSFLPKLLKENYAVLAYDVRGHGQSGKVDDIYALFDDPDLAPKDLAAAIQYLKSVAEVDSNRIGVVGASIGANLACVASSRMGIKTAVAISGKTQAVYNLAGSKKLNLKSVFYIASAGDQNGKRAQWAGELFRMTADPKQIEIVQNSHAHGVSIFKDSPDLQEKILAWLKATL